jgi:hypothetical protein
LDRRLDEHQSCSGRGGIEKNAQPLPGIELWDPDGPSTKIKFAEQLSVQMPNAKFY